MLKYLIIQLDDSSVSFCHYNYKILESHLISLDKLKSALVWSMKENLTVQLLFPDYQLPEDYKNIISAVDHTDIVSSTCEDEALLKKAEVVVFDTWAAINYFQFSENQVYVVRTTFVDLINHAMWLYIVLTKVSRLNIVITDLQNFDEDIVIKYTQFLNNLNDKILKEYKTNHQVQVNILTDRIMIDSMNNCGAGIESITLAPNGKFYICPGFYLDGSTDVGDIENGINVKNPQLYRLDHAPICRTCDAWQCKRCVWLNKKFTLEVNTPGKEQCVIAHLERNASRSLLLSMQENGLMAKGKEISEIDYLDPFDILVNK